MQFGLGTRHQGGLQYQVFRRIADELQFREDDKVRALRSRFRPPFEHGVGIALEVAHGLVQLGERDAQACGHGGALEQAQRNQNPLFTRSLPR